MHWTAEHQVKMQNAQHKLWMCTESSHSSVPSEMPQWQQAIPYEHPFLRLDMSHSWHHPGAVYASVKTPGQSRTVMKSLFSLVSPHSAAELSSPDPSLTSARRQQLLKDSRKCNLSKDPSYPGWFYVMKALRGFLFPLRSSLVPIPPLSLKSLLDLLNLCSRGHRMHWTGGDWSLLFSPHFLTDIEAKILQVQAGICLLVPNSHLPF